MATFKTSIKLQVKNNVAFLQLQAKYMEEIKVSSIGLMVQLTPLSPT